MSRPGLLDRLRGLVAPAAPSDQPQPVPCPRPPPTGEAIARRFGFVRIASVVWDDIRFRGEGMNLLDQAVVLRVSETYDDDRLVVVLMHPEFERLEPGWAYPEYEATFIPHNPFPIWRKV